MSDDEADPELLELLRQSLGLSNHPKDEVSSDTGTFRSAIDSISFNQGDPFAQGLNLSR